MNCDYCDAAFSPKNPRQIYCTKECWRSMEAEMASYSPLDVWMRRPREKILRVMRWHDWLTAREICELVDVPVANCNETPDRAAHDQAMKRLKQQGLIEQRQTRAVYEGMRTSRPSLHSEYRLTQIGKREADRVRFGIREVAA